MLRFRHGWLHGLFMLAIAAGAPVKAAPLPPVAGAVAVTSFRGSGSVPVLLSADWSKPAPEVTRAVITLHGLDGNAGDYARIAEAARARADVLTGTPGERTLLVTPRFLAAGHDAGLPRDALRWADEDWMAGAMAQGPAAISSFEAMDAIVARLSNRTLFPRLDTIVLVGHSGGAQFVQRYAVLNHGTQHLAGAGIAIRYVIANPSSYAYFSPDRPTAAGGFAPYPVDECHRFDDWKYGLHGLPPYASDAPPRDWERVYAALDVTYLLGTADTGTDLPDRSCAAAAEGPTRYARGHTYFRYLQLRDGVALHQQLHDIPGIGHDAIGMLASDCALAAVYDAPVCGKAPARVAAVPAAVAVPVTPQAVPAPHHPHKVAPRRERHPAPAAAGLIWRPGYWVWSGSGYIWIAGAYVASGWYWNGTSWVRSAG